ncbi:MULTISPECIES: ImuA family protein [Limibacillus]|uniref:Protein ImuA n=1 Tax=Limibacillus halophilus TaxID=1579333 RepID=A0A839SNI9_9PROT|nr:hypothetical protein [Limibacillus halophilus]MBB3064467.1 protein ImuA [Limibacillus halophilus]
MKILHLEGGGCSSSKRLKFGLKALDRLLPERGLPLAALHLFEPCRREWDDGVASAFATSLVRLFLQESNRQGPLFWVTRHDDLYGAGLLPFGVKPTDLLVVRAAGDAEVFWCLEEALTDSSPALVLGEIGKLGRIAARRLQLAAEASGIPCFLLLRSFTPPPEQKGSGAFSHWRLAPAPSTAGAAGQSSRTDNRLLGRPRWQVELLHCRGGRRGDCLMEWNDETCAFSMAAPLRDGALPPVSGAELGRATQAS